MKNNLAPLRNAAFRRLLTSYTVNELGDSVGVVALAVLVYDRTHDPLATTLLFLFARFVPAFLSPALTAHLDSRALPRVLGGLYLVEAAAFTALAAVSGAFWLPAVLALALLDGTLALTGRGLTRGAIASVLESDDLLREGNMILDVLVGQGLPVAYSSTSIRPLLIEPDDERGRMLELPEATAALELEETVHLTNGEAVQRSHDVFGPGGLNLHVIRALDRERPTHVGAPSGDSSADGNSRRAPRAKPA